MTASPEAEKPTARALMLHAINTTLLSARQQLESGLAMLAALDALAQEHEPAHGGESPAPMHLARTALPTDDATERRVFGAMRERQSTLDGAPIAESQ